MGVLDGLDAYDTRLAPEDEARFQTWRQGLPRNLQSTRDYDLRGAFLDNAAEASNGHLPDNRKKPNHMTFSDESANRSAENPGGHWSEEPDETWSYQAPPNFERYHSADDLLNYFQAFEAGKRPDGTYGRPNRVILPRGRR